MLTDRFWPISAGRNGSLATCCGLTVRPAVAPSSTPGYGAVEGRFKVHKWHLCSRTHRRKLLGTVDIDTQLFWPMISRKLPDDQINRVLAKPNALVH